MERKGFSITNCKEGNGILIGDEIEVYVSRVKGKQFRLAVRTLNETKNIKKLFGRSKEPSTETRRED